MEEGVGRTGARGEGCGGDEGCGGETTHDGTPVHRLVAAERAVPSPRGGGRGTRDGPRRLAQRVATLGAGTRTSVELFAASRFSIVIVRAGFRTGVPFSDTRHSREMFGQVWFPQLESAPRSWLPLPSCFTEPVVSGRMRAT